LFFFFPVIVLREVACYVMQQLYTFREGYGKRNEVGDEHR
jgi:hypothetical protein